MKNSNQKHQMGTQKYDINTLEHQINDAKHITTLNKRNGDDSCDAVSPQHHAHKP